MDKDATIGFAIGSMLTRVARTMTVHNILTQQFSLVNLQYAPTPTESPPSIAVSVRRLLKPL
jgi:hypothetical protein